MKIGGKKENINNKNFRLLERFVPMTMNKNDKVYY